MENFRIDEILVIKPISDYNPSKREFIKNKKKKKQEEKGHNPKEREENPQEKHIDIYV